MEVKINGRPFLNHQVLVVSTLERIAKLEAVRQSENLTKDYWVDSFDNSNFNLEFAEQQEVTLFWVDALLRAIEREFALNLHDGIVVAETKQPFECEDIILPTKIEIRTKGGKPVRITY